ASKVDTIIIMSGDSDYVELVIHLKGEGVRVEIAAVRKTAAKILIDEADYFHEITKEDLFVYKVPRKPKVEKSYEVYNKS
ncbi:NYN domain-containing protein, partial [bacterium]|nr:NYN domain-containing protein [bacterium]